MPYGTDGVNLTGLGGAGGADQLNDPGDTTDFESTDGVNLEGLGGSGGPTQLNQSGGGGGGDRRVPGEDYEVIPASSIEGVNDEGKRIDRSSTTTAERRLFSEASATATTREGARESGAYGIAARMQDKTVVENNPLSIYEASQNGVDLDLGFGSSGFEADDPTSTGGVNLDLGFNGTTGDDGNGDGGGDGGGGGPVLPVTTPTVPSPETPDLPDPQTDIDVNTGPLAAAVAVVGGLYLLGRALAG